MTPDSMFARSGVPSFWWNAPKYGKNVPSAAATASTRSPHIIHEAPEFMSVKMKRIAVMPKRTSAAPP